MSQEPKSPSVLVAGGVGVDTIVQVPELAIPAGDNLPVPPIADWVAHTGNGVSLGLHSLGLDTTFVDFVGDDEQGAHILNHYQKHGLTFHHLPAPNGTPRSVNLVDQAGSRFSFYDGRHPENLRIPAETYRPLLQQATHAHVSITNVTRELLDEAIQMEIPISTDLHAWDGLSDHHRNWAYKADFVFMSTEKLGGYRAGVMRDIYESGRAKHVIAMAGAAGCYVLEPGKDVTTHYPAIVPRNDLAPFPEWKEWLAIDSNGAGDAFVSGFLHTYLRGGDLEKAILAGRISGAFACRKSGTHSEFISEDLLARSVTALS